MSCQLVMTLLSENQEGECGKDWKYKISARVVSESYTSEGHISVPRHTLPVGVTQKPFGDPAPEVVYSGDCLTELVVKLELHATELDPFVDDNGTASMEFKLDCPGPGASTMVKTVDIAAGVREAPLILSKDAVFSVRVRFELICD